MPPESSSSVLPCGVINKSESPWPTSMAVISNTPGCHCGRGGGGLVSAIAGYVLGLVMVRYREIFFAMLSLALSMILYGILVRSVALGSTDRDRIYHNRASSDFPSMGRPDVCSSMR